MRKKFMKKKNTGRKMVSVKYKIAVKKTVAVFMVTAMRISTLMCRIIQYMLYGACKQLCKNIFFQVKCAFLIYSCVVYQTHCVFPDSHSRILKFLHFDTSMYLVRTKL